MKQKWYLLIACLFSCVAVWAQGEGPSWSIEDLKLTEVSDDNKKVVKLDDTFNLPSDATGVKAKIEFNLRMNPSATEENEDEDVVIPDFLITCGNYSPSFEPVTKEIEGKDSLWSCTIDFSLPLDQLSKDKDLDITCSFKNNEDGNPASTQQKVHVWTLPDDPSLTPTNYTTFTDLEYTFSVSESNKLSGFTATYRVEGKDISKDKQYSGYSPKEISNDKTEKPIKFEGEYRFGDSNGPIWKTFENENAAKLITYHRPVYQYSIKINGQEQNGKEATVTHSDEVDLIVTHQYGYGDNNYTQTWDKGNGNFTAENTNEININDDRTITMINKIADGIEDEQKETFSITVLPEIKVGNTIELKSYSFIPEDDTKIAIKKIHNQDDLKWDITWNFDGSDIESSSNDSFEKNIVTISKEKLKDSGDHTLKAKVTCYKENNKEKLYLNEETITHTIVVVKDPQVTEYGEYDGQDNIITCDGQKFIIDIKTKGGYSDGYEFHLKSIGGEGNYGKSDKEEGTTYTITYNNDTGTVVSSDFKLEGKNSIPDRVSTTGKEESRKVEGADKTFHATIYPYPEVQFKDKLENYFYGSTIKKELESKYPLPEENNEWEFEWEFDNEVQGDFTNKSSFEKQIPNGGDSEKEEHKLVINAVNKYNGKEWGKQKLPFTFYAWHRANLDGIGLSHENSSNTNIYEGHTFNLSALTKYGYPKGWKYIWKRDDNTEVLSGKETDEFEAKFYGNDGSENQTYKLHVENSIPGLDEGSELLFQDDASLSLTIWRKAENYVAGSDASIITITDKENGATITDRIREGRELLLQVPQAQYGYNNDWTYTWNGTDLKVPQITLPIDNVQASGEAMKKELRTISLIITNMGPNDQPWERTPMSRTYSVYRKPKTPTSLAQKGNGVSRTLIATTAISDQQLQDNDYYLCFGHRETNGAVTLISEPILQEGPGQTRFSMQVPQDLWNDKNNLCVFALWHYSDGPWITSGLRFISDVKEDWDGSDYTGKSSYSGTTRGGDTTGIQETAISSQDIQATYGINGTVRGTMQRGLNIVRMADGTVRKVIKK